MDNEAENFISCCSFMYLFSPTYACLLNGLWAVVDMSVEIDLMDFGQSRVVVQQKKTILFIMALERMSALRRLSSHFGWSPDTHLILPYDECEYICSGVCFGDDWRHTEGTYADISRVW